MDDVNLYATTPKGLQTLLDRMNEFLAQCGMNININKSFVLGFEPSPRDKISTIDIKTRFTVGGRELKSLRRTDEWNYLGVPFTWAGRTRIKISEELQQDLLALTKGPLKSEQRLFALRTMVLPKLYHQLALGNVMLGTLKSADKKLTAAIRKWLNLPHDVPNAYVYSSIVEGGLGIPAIR